MIYYNILYLRYNEVYNIMIRYSYISGNDHYNKSGSRSSPYIVTKFFSLVIRTLEIYSPRNFQIYNTELLN